MNVPLPGLFVLTFCFLARVVGQRPALGSSRPCLLTLLVLCLIVISTFLAGLVEPFTPETPLSPAQGLLCSKGFPSSPPSLLSMWTGLSPSLYSPQAGAEAAPAGLLCSNSFPSSLSLCPSICTGPSPYALPETNDQKKG